MTPDTWLVPSPGAPVRGRVVVPGSKSETNRALVLAALADGPSRIAGLPASRDTDLMAGALARFGADVQVDGDEAVVTPPTRWRGGADIDCGLAGTVMRFVPALAMLADGPCRFHGDAQASLRPMAALVAALRGLGATVACDHGDDALPFTLAPPAPWRGNAVTIDSSATSQYVSGLLLAAAAYPGGIDLTHAGGPLPSLPHIDMTVQMLAAHGVAVAQPQPDRWVVAPGQVRASDAVIEPDLTNAAAFLLAGVLTGGDAEVAHWPARTTQAGDLIRPVIEAFGGWTAATASGGLAAGARRPLLACDTDLSSASELTPVVAALAAAAPGVTRLTGIGHIRGHETNRLTAIADALGAVGAPVTIDDDGLTITGGATLHGGVVEARGDHRLVHLGALLGLLTPGVVVAGPGAAAKTMPDFTDRWAGLVRGAS